MNKRYNSIDRLNFKGHSSSIKNVMHLGGENVILGPKFDIRKYFNELSKQKLNQKSPKRTIPNKPSLLYPPTSPKTKKSYNISTSNYKSQIYNTVENESNANRRSEYIFNTNRSSKNIYYNHSRLRNNTIENQCSNCFLTSLDIEKNIKNKSYKTIDARDYIIPYSSKNDKNKKLFTKNKLNKAFHISNIIKEIKEKYKIKNEQDIKNYYISYKKENIDAVINASNILNNYNEKNDWNLRVNVLNFHNFAKNNKNIYRQNLLTKLVNREREKLIENEKAVEKNIKNKHDMIIKDEEEFEKLVVEQKQYNKTIEDYRIRIENTNKELYYLKNLMSYKVQNKEAEIMKKLLEMEELRGYAKFINNMLGKDTSIFEKEIYPMDYERKIELNNLVKNAFKIYKDYLNENSEENQKRNEGNEPEIIYSNFLGLEDKIGFKIKEKDKEYEEIEKIKMRNKLLLKEIKNKKNFLEEEYNSLKIECDNIKNIISKEEKKDNYMSVLAKDFFIYILKNLSEENLKKYLGKSANEVSESTKTVELAEKTRNCIYEKEIYINEAIKNIEIFEEKNPEKFEEILDSAKDRIILQRQKEAKELRKIKEKIKKIQAMKKLEKISFIIRRVEAPFHVKKKKEIKIDPDEVREKENKELMTYQ